MEVRLTKRILGLGMIGDVISVSDARAERLVELEGLAEYAKEKDQNAWLARKAKAEKTTSKKAEKAEKR